MDEFLSKNKLKVKFATENSPPKINEIVILRSWRTWNDLGYVFSCRGMVVNPLNNSISYFESFIGFLPPEDPSLAEHDFFRRYKGSFIDAYEFIDTYSGGIENGRVRFFSMLPTIGDYRKIVEELGKDFAVVVLHSLNDLVLNKDINPKWYKEAVSSHVFRYGFMRDSEPYFAYNNAGDILYGLEREKFDGISQRLHLQYKLDGFSNAHSVTLKYDSNGYIPKRINILIGKNGVGKSQGLKAFCRAALRYDDNNISLLDADSGDRPMISRLLAIATPGESSYTFPDEKRKTQKLHYRRLSLTRNARTKSDETVPNQLMKLIRLDEKIGNLSRWDIFKKSISSIASLDRILIVLDDNSSISLAELDVRHKDNSISEYWGRIDIVKEPRIGYSDRYHVLSSGQIMFFKFALLCCLHIENGSFILLDEPETHMHPNMISDFIELLDTLLESTGSQALIATHSAYFVREVSREQVHILKSEGDDNIIILSPRLRTFGSDIDSISQFVFEEDIESKLTDKIFEKVKSLKFEQVEEQLSKELSLSALMDIKNRMERNNEGA